LVLANFGRPEHLRIDSVPVGRLMDPPRAPSGNSGDGSQGSCIVVIATDAPASSRQLIRLARRAQSGLARTGSFCEHGSGEYVMAFSTATRVPHWVEERAHATPDLPEDGPVMDQLFQATVEATEEAVVNALFTAETVRGLDEFVAHALPAETVVDAIRGRPS
jgi:D-aminopeptidase